MALVTNITMFKKYVKYNFTSEDINSLLDTGPAERKYIKPILGTTLYNSLVTQVTNNAITTPDLLELVRAAIVPITVYADLPLLQVQIGDAGIKKSLSENSQSAFRWEFNEVKDYLDNKGSEAVDQLITYLFENKVTLGWTVPEEWSLAFKNGSEFSKFFALKYPHRTYMMLLDLVSDVEEQYIQTTIGEAFYKNLIVKSNPGTEEKEALRLIKKSIANLTIMKAIEKRPVKITAGGFFVTLAEGNDDANQKEKSSNQDVLREMRNAVERDGESYLLKLKSYLNEKATPILFALYYGSSIYVAPSGTAPTERNSDRKGTFKL